MILSLIEPFRRANLTKKGAFKVVDPYVQSKTLN